jgi:hypothetical protein
MRRDKASFLHTAVIAAVLLGGPVIAFAQTSARSNTHRRP